MWEIQQRTDFWEIFDAELVVILRNDFEDLVANRPDFIPTYNLESWDTGT